MAAVAKPRVAIVTTTIFVPKALDAYFSNAVKYGHQDTLFVVTGDKKTPAEARGFCAEASKRHGVECVYLDCDEQDAWLERYPEMKAHLPWNCIQRRNISIFYAYERGCDPIITIDDDNYIVDGQDYIGDHIRGMRDPKQHTLLQSATGWVNICDFLEEKRGYTFYARGFPMKQRWLEYPPITRSVKSDQPLVVNAGLWLDDPDLDAITRLCNSICATRYKREENFALGNGTWSPFNSQNTALSRQVVEAYWLSPFVGRYDDIWASYVVCRITDHLRHEIFYGFPIVKQERNPHNFFVDHRKEEDGLELTDLFCELLRSIPLTKDTYFDCFSELLPQLKTLIAQQTTLKPEKRAFLDAFISSNEVFQVTMAKMRTAPPA